MRVLGKVGALSRANVLSKLKEDVVKQVAKSYLVSFNLARAEEYCALDKTTLRAQ